MIDYITQFWELAVLGALGIWAVKMADKADEDYMSSDDEQE